jgi:hypothetical protein
MEPEIATAQKQSSNITFKMYVNVLERISLGQISSVSALSLHEKRICKELKRSSLVSDDPKEAFGRALITGSLVITPEGIAALDSWLLTLKKSSWSYKFGDSLLRLLWVFVGALAASIPSVLNCLNP